MIKQANLFHIIKRFHLCLNHKKKLSLRHPLPTFGSFSFFQSSLWLGVDKVLQKLTKSYKLELKYLFQCCISIPRKCPCKTPLQHTVCVWGGGELRRKPSPPPEFWELKGGNCIQFLNTLLTIEFSACPNGLIRRLCQSWHRISWQTL